jgi:hypothetical protein
MANNTTKMPFNVAAVAYAQAKHKTLEAAAKAEGFGNSFFSNLKTGKYGGLRRGTLLKLYAAFPELEAAVKSGLVSSPPKPKFKSSGRKAAPKLPTQNELVIELSRLRGVLREAFPNIAHLI